MEECEVCGSEEGFETVCPFADEVHGEIVPVVLCPDCYDDRVADI